jgi:hypothetical protein
MDVFRRHTDGTLAGEKIPGSRLYRAFCQGCGTAIRFQASGTLDAHARCGSQCCEECRGDTNRRFGESAKRSDRIAAEKAGDKSRFNAMKKKEFPYGFGSDLLEDL